MKLARWVFRVAGIYGIIVLAPMLFMEHQMALGVAATDLVFAVLFVAAYRATRESCGAGALPGSKGGSI